MKNLQQEYLGLVSDNMIVAAGDMDKAVEYIRGSSATFTRGQLSMMSMPKMHTRASYATIKSGIDCTYRILDKIIQAYLDSAEIRELFPFDERLQELILLPKQYSNNLPICRLDIFLNEETYDFKFCEFNADGASAMNEDREVYNAWTNSDLWGKLRQRHSISTFELFDSWVSEFALLYDEYASSRGKGKHKPRVAIVDFLDIGTKSEFTVFKQAFERAGYECSIEDITTLVYTDGQLMSSDGVVIDAIYRRAVTSECMDKYTSIAPFIQSVIDDKVCIVGAFRTQVIHDKNLFRLLRHKTIQTLLTQEEIEFVDRHVPKTYLLNHGDYDKIAVLNNKDKWIIKPSDRYGSFDVHTGGDYGDLEWYDIINSFENKGYILQEYCPPYRGANLYFDKGLPIYGDYGYMTGVFVYSGKVAGLYTRCMLRRTTTQKDEGRVTCSVVVD